MKLNLKNVLLFSTVVTGIFLACTKTSNFKEDSENNPKVSTLSNQNGTFQFGYLLQNNTVQMTINEQEWRDSLLNRGFSEIETLEITYAEDQNQYHSYFTVIGKSTGDELTYGIQFPLKKLGNILYIDINDNELALSINYCYPNSTCTECKKKRNWYGKFESCDCTYGTPGNFCNHERVSATFETVFDWIFG